MEMMEMDLSQKVPKLYKCEKCDYHTSDTTDYNKHLATDKHRKNELERVSPRQIPKTYTCELCDYHTYVRKDYLKHLGTNKHVSKTNSHEKSQTNPRQIPDKSPQIYTCELCDYQSVVKKDYTKHLESKKHMDKESSATTDETAGNPTHKYTCDICNKSYYAYSGLWKHKKTCIAKEEDEEEEDEEADDDEDEEEDELDDADTVVEEKLKEKLKEELKNELKEELKSEIRPFDITAEMFMELLKNNKEFQAIILEDRKIMLEDRKLFMEQMSKNNQSNVMANSNNTTTNSNNSFNLNFFLNEQCKNALNVNDFVDSLNPSFQDMERTGRLGFVEGITSIFLNGLRELDVYTRPIHCTDLKRESLYVKDNDKWEKEPDDKPRLRKAIKRTANKNLKQIKLWEEQHPDFIDTDTQASEDHVALAQKLLGGTTPYESEKFENSIIRNVLRGVTIDKEALTSS